MEFYNTVTLSNKNFEMIIDLLEEACESSNNYDDIEEYVSIIKTIEEEIEKDEIKTAESIKEPEEIDTETTSKAEDMQEETKESEEEESTIEGEINAIITFLMTL